MTAPLPAREPWLSTALRVCAHAITGAVLAWPLSVAEGVVAAAVGGGTGALAARFVAGSRVRLAPFLGAAAAGLFAVASLRGLTVGLDALPASLGPSGALLTGEMITFGLGGFIVSGTLRVLSNRHRSFALLEVGLVAGGFATLLVAHRHGAIHRPHVLADPLIAAGEDPTVAILAIGTLGAATIGLLLLSERSLLKSAFHLAVVALLLLIIFGTTTMAELPTPEGSDALGLRREDEGQPSSASGGGGQGRRDSDELEFRDQYSGGGASADAVVIFHSDYSPPSGYYYFRQNAFSQFNGRKLVAATIAGVDEDVRNLFPTRRAQDVGWTPGPGVDRAEVETTVALLANNSAPLGLEAPTRFMPATNPNPQRFRRVYRTRSVSTTAEPEALFGRRAGDPAWDERTRAHYLQLPSDPRYRTLAARIIDQLPEQLRADPVAVAFAITHYLGQNGTYSLRSRHTGHDDPTGHFLFGDLTGYCVHFAHAAVFLLRAAGVPARVGTGYAVAESNRQGGSALLLRNSDQHAWPEVFVGGMPSLRSPGLIALEAYRAATADGAVDRLPVEVVIAAALVLDRVASESAPELEPVPLPQPPTGAALDRYVDRVASALGTTPEALIESVLEAEGAEPPAQAGWVVFDVAPETVLDGASGEPPDPQLQRLLGEMLRGSTVVDDAPVSPRPMRELVRRVTRPLGLTLAGALGLFLLVGYAIKLWRGLAPRVGAPGTRPRLIYRATLDRLSEVGLRRAYGEAPESFALREASRIPGLRALTMAHLASAFGGRLDQARVSSMQTRAREVGAQLRGAVPWWRRALGLLNPYSWLLSR